MSEALAPAITRLGRWHAAIAPFVFAVLTLAMFADVLLGPRGRILSAERTDLVNHFVASREFGFGELSRGNVALWNPYMFCGYPYHGGFQPALFYPPNWIHLILPLDFSINLTLALHTFLAGYFTYLWLRHSFPLLVLREGGKGDGVGLEDPANDSEAHPLPCPSPKVLGARVAAILGGVIFMFCARFFLHIYAGHVPHVCLMPWVPLLLLSIDGLTKRGRLGFALLGAAALSMMILAGYPQMVYYTAVVAPVYAIARWSSGEHKLVSLAGFAAIALLAAGLTAIQVLPGLDATAESVRSAGTTYRFAASFSFPPENLLTAVAPDALGHMEKSRNDKVGYFGQAYLWETSTFIGSITMVLAIYAVAACGRRAILPVAMVIVSALLGLGANTPLHRLMYDWLPGFSTFRGSSKFLFLTSLFLAQLAAMGFGALLRRNQAERTIVIIAAAAALMLATGVWWIRSSAADGVNGGFAGVLVRIAERGIERDDGHFDIRKLSDQAVILKAADVSSRSIFASVIWIVLAGAAIVVSRWWRLAVYGVALLAAAEVFAFARAHRVTSPMDAPLPQVWADALDGLADGARFVRNGSAYDRRPGRQAIPDAWGYDPGVLRRYAELMYFGQGLDPDGVESGLGFGTLAPPICRLARIGVVLESRPQVAAYPTRPLVPLSQAMLVPSARVVSSRDQMFAILSSPGFDPSYTVLLESQPNIYPVGRTPTAARMRVIDTDTREIEVEANFPSMLLITEAFSRHWQVMPLAPPPGGQAEYRLMPANWAFMAIPLTQGRHHVQLVYRPPGYALGRTISVGTLIVFVGLCAWTARRTRRLPPPAAQR